MHGNIKYIDQEVYVQMRDITSSYPYSMLTKYFPVTEFIKIKLSYDIEEYGDEPVDFLQLLETKCCKLTCIYHHIEAMTDHSYESRSKVMEYLPEENDPVYGLDNGRIRRAEYVKVMQTELDYKIYQMLYHYESVEIVDIQISDRGPLPDFLLQCLIEDYKEKNNLKVQGLSGNPDYALKKADVNTYFGMLVKAIYQVNVGYDGGDWIDTTQSLTDIQMELNDRFLSYDWGIWVCAHSRYKLIDMMMRVEAVGGKVIYGDTDSIKYIEDKFGRCAELFRWMNEKIREENKLNPLLQDEAFYGMLGRGIGEWDDELSNKLYNKPFPVK